MLFRNNKCNMLLEAFRDFEVLFPYYSCEVSSLLYILACVIKTNESNLETTGF